MFVASATSMGPVFGCIGSTCTAVLGRVGAVPASGMKPDRDEMLLLATVPISAWIVAPNGGQVAIGRPSPSVDAAKGQKRRCPTVTRCHHQCAPTAKSAVVAIAAVVHGWLIAPLTSQSMSTTGEESSLWETRRAMPRMSARVPALRVAAGRRHTVPVS